MKLQMFVCLLGWLSPISAHFLYNPYRFFRYGHPSFGGVQWNSASHAPNYSPYVPPYTSQFYGNPVRQFVYDTPSAIPGINLLAETPYTVEKTFSVVPMLVVSDDNLNVMHTAEIMQVSKKKPTMTVKTNKNTMLQCTPAVKIALKSPILLYNLKSSILFPSAMSILHGNTRIPIRVGAVIAPVHHDTYVSEENPIAINIVYAIPTKPIQFDYVNNEKDIFIDQDSQAVVVDTLNKPEGQKIPILNFPDSIAEPVVGTGGGDDDELVNRNPPQPLAPSGIVQSTQPHTSYEIFTNSKESPFLTTLREESKLRL